MKTKKSSKRRIKRSKIKINLRKRSGGYSSHVKMLMHHHNKVISQINIDVLKQIIHGLQ